MFEGKPPSMAADRLLDQTDAVRALEWEEVVARNPRRARALDAVIDSLRSWDRVATVESVPTTLFVLWQERLRSGDYARYRRRQFLFSFSLCPELNSSL